jgi:two-component system alkaline phosphatase synthesis response regulator PhoP
VLKGRILVVDDEPDILDLVKYNLDKEGYDVSSVLTGEEALQITQKIHPDLILLDLMLPGLDGLEVCKTLKKQADTSEIPIIMLTAKGEESDVVTGLEIGADDYISKPFSPKVLIARVRAMMRRKKQATQSDAEKKYIRIHEFEIDPGRHIVTYRDEPVNLTYTEFRLLQILADRPGWVFTRFQIVDALRGEDYPVTERSVDVQIVGLRKKLGDGGRYIETVRGVGYRFRE